MKKIFLLLFTLILSFFIYFFIDFFVLERDINKEIIEVKKGYSYKKVYNVLNINYTLSDKIYLKFNTNLKLKEGYYKLDKKITKFKLLNSFQKEYINNIKLTIPEGFTQKQVLERIEALGLANKIDMLDALNSVDFPYIHPKDNYEGYLYPETYIISSYSKPIDIAKTILNQFLKEFPSENYPDKVKFYDNLKLASIVEFETANFEDKSKVAGVFKRRLKINMKLQSDATLKYELGRQAYKRELLNSKSLYNTYYIYGLPPTPISNPSKETILETLNAPMSEYTYFFMSNGKTYYSKTHTEHLIKRNEVK